MRKFIIILLIFFCGMHSHAQVYNNEWLDYNKTYYKFKVGRSGLFRIFQSTLAAAGLGNTPAEQFQLWRNGEQVPIFTSVANGLIPANGYIEFWGIRNDGKPDKALYKDANNQLSDALSLETDTAAFYLTANTNIAANFRLQEVVNDIAGNTLLPDPYFIHHYRYNLQFSLNPGKPVYFGEYVYSSTYDVGEWWASNDINPSDPLQINTGNLYVALSGPAAKLQVSFVGNSFLGVNRSVEAAINGTTIINQPLTTINAAILTNTVDLSLINTPAVNFSFSNISNDANDRIAVGFVDLEYPRLFDFDFAANFEFSLPANNAGNYLQITNFNKGIGAAPVLYDITNQKRYVADTGQAGVLRFAVGPSAVDRNLVLVSEDNPNINPVSALVKRNFVDFTNTAVQGDYLIITNKILTSGSTVINDYKAYRSSVAGGGYNAKIFDIDELVDQFAFGIKEHPLSVKNFLRYARTHFSVAPKFVFLIGKAVAYNEFRYNEASPYDEKLNLIPTFGWPASDNMLASDGFDPVPATPIGRLAVISSQEVQVYLDKIKQYELAQQSTNQTIEEKIWMKTMVHVVGANDPSLDYLGTYLNTYKDIIQGPLYGANVTTFSRLTTGPETPVTNALMTQLFNGGVSMLNYFGHSAATSLDYNLYSPDQFSNFGKYPVFLVNGCNAGNIYSYDTSRLSLISSLSEKFVLAKDKGAIAFIASSHFGVANYLDTYNQSFYNSLAGNGYDKAISTNIKNALATLVANTSLDSTTRYLHAEENILHGDPAIKINPHAKPDYVVEDPSVIINPSFISVADNAFTIKAIFYNIGNFTGDSVSILVRRQYPDGTTVDMVNKKVKAFGYADSLMLSVPINTTKDIGTNKLIVTIDNTGEYDELSELNNTVTKTFEIYEDALKPVYPYNFSIVNRQNIKLVASTANPIMPSKAYIMQIDTTELFNSPLRYSETINSVGGVLEFNPGLTFADSTVYYWRVAAVTSDGNNIWNKSSFIYLPGSSFGYNQSHVYQHLKSQDTRIYLDSSSRKWMFTPSLSAFKIVHSIFPTSGLQPSDFMIQINGGTVTKSACLGHSVIFNVFDPANLQLLYNQAVPSTTASGIYGGFMGSAGTCNMGGPAGTEHNFEFSYLDTTGRRKMRDFMDWIPDGYIVSARQIFDQPFDQQPFVDVWKNDEQIYGAGNTAYNRLLNAGFAGIDQYTYPRTWAFLYAKNTPLFSPQWVLTAGLDDQVALTRDIPTPDTLGYISSPLFGPAAAWKQVTWRGSSLDATAGDLPSVDVIGVDANGLETVLYTLTDTQQDIDITSVSPIQFPYIRLQMRNADSIHFTPYQLRYWRILYDPVPEGALAPNINYGFKDTLSLGQQSMFTIAFKNVSDVAFTDSIKVNFTINDAANVATNIPIPKLKKLNPGDTATINYQIDTKNFSGNNNIYLDINPANDQPEQTHFNNFLYKNFLVKPDDYKPVLDVTFDGIHILNNDVVSAAPQIIIKLKDESKYLLLDDTALLNVQLQYPDGTLRRFYFNNDTLRFTPATSGEADNTATVNFSPYFLQDGTYQLIVHGKDKTNNTAGSVDYVVSFQVYNKPMISNMFNYPNPFTSSTAFVFTITGSVVPQNIRIQVLTITGKIVKEITKEELGNLHIGRNITDYKWDGTDMYGQKLANGVYLYRVITNQNGNRLDKFPTYGTDGFEVNTDKYFNKGYGKMYLMR